MKLLRTTSSLLERLVSTSGSMGMLRPLSSPFFQMRFLSSEEGSGGGGGMGTSKGQVALRTPSKVHLECGKVYNWCACGLSSKQPLCDGSHKNSPLGLKPVGFKAPESKDYMFCNCKQTDKRPFCDGTHKKL